MKQNNIGRALRAFLTIAAFLAANFLIDGIMGSAIPLILSLAAGEGFIGVINYMAYGLLASQLTKLILLYFFINKRTGERPYIKHGPIKNFKPILVGLGTVGFGLLLTNSIVVLMEGSPELESALKLLEEAFKSRGQLNYMVIFLVTVIGAPIVEELCFRGVLFEELDKSISSKAAGFLTALIFGFYHLNIIQSPNTFFMGLVLVYVYYKRRNIKDSILIHLTNNLMAFLPFMDRGLSPGAIILYLSLMLVGVFALVSISKED